MKRDLTRTADRACWISGDRVNACVSADANGVIELGFHGLQPVSRNSRLLVRQDGVLTMALLGPDGRETPFTFSIVDHRPHSVTTVLPVTGGESLCEVIAAHRAVHLFVRCDVPAMQLIVRFALDAVFSDVRGDRVWTDPIVSGRWLTVSCHDRIELDSWLKRTGPYAGDFLIPEHWRRLIFNRPLRSGLATPGDLRPEYLDAPIAIYDARSWMVAGSRQGTLVVEGQRATWVIPVDGSRPDVPLFSIGGSESDPGGTEERVVAPWPIDRVRERMAVVEGAAPRMQCAALPELSMFMGTVPGLVCSCTVHDAGMTRATPGAYYWLWAWDNLVTGQECLRWGDTALAGSMIRYVHAHRDIDGTIPARWTRSDEPMDTPPHGALDFLLLHLAYEHARATGERTALLSLYPHAVGHLRRSMAADPEGLVPNLSFYPDRPIAFGRSEQSVVALETGCLYSFARLMDTIAVMIGDDAVRNEACRYASAIERVFLEKFWDAARGFLVDSFHRESGKRNEAYPLFSLLFLQYAPGMHLVRPVVPAMGQRMAVDFLTDLGVRMLPGGDTRVTGEDALGAWYPHWDVYLLKVLRRAGDAEAIGRWARSAERLLSRLGIVPEFITLGGLTEDAGPAWRRHGAVSNLNCVTGWHRAIAEGLCGIELDPGGMSVIPLGLDIGPVTLRGYNVRGTLWDIEIDHAGPHLEEIRIDGQVLEGCLKIPVPLQDRGHHRLTVRYGATPCRVLLREVLNAEIHEVRARDTGTLVRIHALGMTDLIVADPGAWRITIDGVPAFPRIDAATGYGSLRIGDPGVHDIAFAVPS